MMFRRLIELPSTLTGEWRDLLPALRPLMQAVQEAQRIIFAEHASIACYDLAADRKSLERARPQIIAPFAEAWIEMVGAPDIGMLWQSELGSAQRGSLKLLTWPRNHPVPVVYDCTADIANPSRPPLMLTEASRRALVAACGTGGAGPYVAGHIATGEWIATPMLAAFALLSSKGMTETRPADMDRLNRERAKAGKYPLLGYDEIRLNIDAERVVRDGRRVVATGTMPMHWVRAHLRLLASGRVTIVRAHVRGDPQHGIKRSHYTVTNAEDA